MAKKSKLKRIEPDALAGYFRTDDNGNLFFGERKVELENVQLDWRLNTAVIATPIVAFFSLLVSLATLKLNVERKPPSAPYKVSIEPSASSNTLIEQTTENDPPNEDLEVFCPFENTSQIKTGKWVVTASNLNVRSSNSRSSDVLDVLEEYAIVKSICQLNGWSWVSYQSNFTGHQQGGWVYNQYLTEAK